MHRSSKTIANNPQARKAKKIQTGGLYLPLSARQNKVFNSFRLN